MERADQLNLIGTTVAEKYAVESLVGEGGFAVVYRANHTIWKRPVALKVFKGLARFDSAERQKLIDAFVDEGKVLAELSERSAAICQARDVGTLTTPSGDLPFLVLEWLEGASLDRVLVDEAKRALPRRSLEEVVTFLEPIAEALALAHRRGIAHRDVKPSNLFILGEPRGVCTLKLLDFGIAKVAQDARTMENGGDAFVLSQVAGTPSLFTPAYGAPEQFSRSLGATGPWTDVFALALIAVELMSGEPALGGDSLAQIGFASSDPNRRPTPRTLGLSVSDEVENVFARALAVVPKERFPDAGEFWSKLRRSASVGASRTGFDARIAAQTGEPVLLSSTTMSSAVARPATAEAPAPRSGTSKAKLGVGLAVAAMAVAGGVFAVQHLRTPGEPAGAVGTEPSAADAESAVPAVVVEPSCDPQMIAIRAKSDAGRHEFFMGSDDGLDFEKPAHKVILGSFCMDEFEVTTEAYQACVDRGACPAAGKNNVWDGISAKEKNAFDPLCNARAPEDRGKHPINCVTWADADTFCRAQGKRLPTEAEWEFAARGPDGRIYPWGDEEPSANFLNACGAECVAWGKRNRVEEQAMYGDDDGFPNTAPVGSFPAGKSRYGVQDVVGNVWEWVSDYYAPYDGAIADDPRGPAEGDERVIRGGGWNGAYPSWVRPTFRYHADPEQRSYGIGFRCAKELGS